MGELERKVGRLFMVGVPGESPDGAFLEELAAWGAGGIIFFSRHTKDLDRLRRDIGRIRDACPAAPLFAIDHEGGPVMRFGSGVSELPSAMGLAAAAGPGEVREACAAAARELRALGLTVNLAPVCDVNDRTNPGIGVRSYGDLPERVARYAAAATDGYVLGGVQATCKHFPGKGAATVDAHVAMPTVPASATLLWDRELPPFCAAIGAGAGLVMTSHVLYPALDAENPATFSPAVVQTLLRDELGFEGVAVTDDLEMGGSRQHATPEEAALRSLRAGHDLALICHTFEAQQRARRILRDAVRSGDFPEAELDVRFERVEACCARAERTPLACAPDPTLIDRLAARSLVRLPGGEDVLPLGRRAPFRPVLYVPDLSSVGPGVGDRGGSAARFVLALGARLPRLRVVRFDQKGRLLDDRRPLHVDGAAPAVFLSYNAHLSAGQAALLRHVHQAARGRVVHVALRNPYDLSLLPAGPTVARVAAFGFRSNVLRALASLLLGDLEPTGRMPVALA